MRVVVVLPGVLREQVGGLRRLDVDVGDDAVVRDVFNDLAGRYPLLERRVRDETGRVREHVNVFLGDDNIKDLDHLETRLVAGAEITVLPAVSGG